MIVTLDSAPAQTASAYVCRDDSLHTRADIPVIEGGSSGGPMDDLAVTGASTEPMTIRKSGGFDWSDRAVKARFVRLEQAVLLNIADDESRILYEDMKRERQEIIFGETAWEDYLEERRLQRITRLLDQLEAEFKLSKRHARR